MSDELMGLTIRQIREKARADAARVLDKHWVGGSIPVDPVMIARSLGVQVFSAQLGDDAWGMIVGSGSGVDIYLDQDQPPNRFRFSCAHEVGHFVERGADLDPDEAFVERRSESDRGRADEVYANEFAASLLMPEEQFKSAVASGMDTFDLGDKFEVSFDAVRWRRTHLGV